jgi:peptidoglycan/LPS O-acetylase OafA/YrhL
MNAPDTSGIVPPVATPAPARDGHVAALDGVREIAVILVMAFHIWRGPVTALGWSGVDLFFVLSGFLITGILWDARSSPGRARTFYIRRALRILPLYYGVLIAVFVVRPLLGLNHRLDDVALTGERLWYWSYLCDWRIALGHPHAVTYLTHFWSLSIEEQFYLVWPLVVWNCSRQTVIRVAGALAVGALALRCYVVWVSAMPGAAYALLPCRVDALAVGAILALTLRSPGGVPSVRRWVVPASLAGLAIVAALAILRPTVKLDDPGMMTIGYTALDWCFAGLVFAAATTRSNLLELGFLRAAGRYSYGLYVFHPLVMWWIVRDVPWLERSELGFVLGSAIGSVVIAYVSYHAYERPFLRLKTRFAAVRSEPGTPAPYRIAA